jgi:putative MATE family efflux protein
LARTLKKQSIDRILNHPSILKGIVIMAIPVFLNNLLKSLHDMVDAIFIARMPNQAQDTLDAALTAVNIHWPVYFLFMALGTGLGVATVAMVSQYVGANRMDLAKKYSSQLIFLAVLVSLLSIFVFMITSDLVLGYNLFAYLMGARGEALDFAGSYFRIRSFDLLFVFIFLVYQAIRQSTGETLQPVILNICAILMNIFLTWLFVSRMNLGIDGAAYATLISHIGVTPFIVYDLFKSKKHITIALKEMPFSQDTVRDMVSFAWPATAGQAISSLGFVVIQSIILFYGNDVSAGFSVGNRIAMLLLNPVVALSSVLAAYVGLNIGHGQGERAKASYRVARNASLFLMIIGISVVIPLRHHFIYLILGTRTSSSYQIASEYTFWILFTQPFMAMFTCYTGLFNGSGYAKFTLRMALLRLWGMRIPLVILFMFIFPRDNYSGIWYAMIISNIAILFYGNHLKEKINYQVQVRL